MLNCKVLLRSQQLCLKHIKSQLLSAGLYLHEDSLIPSWQAFEYRGP